MRLDEKRTADARAAQKAAIRSLRKLFASGPKGQMMMEFGRWRSLQFRFRGVRMRPGVPVARDAATKARHLRRKRAKAARRRNRRA